MLLDRPARVGARRAQRVRQRGKRLIDATGRRPESFQNGGKEVDLECVIEMPARPCGLLNQILPLIYGSGENTVEPVPGENTFVLCPLSFVLCLPFGGVGKRQTKDKGQKTGQK